MQHRYNLKIHGLVLLCIVLIFLWGWEKVVNMTTYYYVLCICIGSSMDDFSVQLWNQLPYFRVTSFAQSRQISFTLSES